MNKCKLQKLQKGYFFNFLKVYHNVEMKNCRIIKLKLYILLCISFLRNKFLLFYSNFKINNLKNL